MIRSSLQALGGAVFVISLSLAAIAADRVPADSRTTSQKAKFVENLVARSVSARKIEQSGDASAIQTLGEARALVQEAKKDLQRNAVEAADQKLDRALALINTETRRLSADDVTVDRQREAYDKRRRAVEAFLVAYRRVASGGSSSSAARHADEIESLIADADRSASSGDMEAAIEKLDEAYRFARGDIREMRDGKTLTRTLDFATAEEEYDYELGRNRSHFLLLEFAFGEKNPQGSVLGRIRENQTSAEGLRRKAESRAAKGDHAAAIDLLDQSTRKLLEAIRMSGVFVPG